ncbi:HAD family hydrolase [Lactobacillus melliventris]|uniref:HAD family hydrolase n=1 Tax=Lactobacillus melliventris TaxID=1218507 RepID=UPI0015803B80|nr:HAD family hydrolase [Lactobacillus melliventris]NUE98051.1 HAD family hydrolase [Lactobacillus melliventris]
MAKYETLIFILEGSLLNEKVAELNALSQTLKLAGREFGPAQRIQYNSVQEKIKLLGFDERIKLTLQEFFKNDWISAKQAFDNQLQKQDQLNKDVLPFLDEVKNKVNLILLTKEKKDVASSRMQSTELLNYFSAVYFKDDLTSKLPDKKVLTTILHQQNLSPATCLVIGTNLVDEIQGAENANLDSLWLSPKKVKMPISPHPTLHLNKLSDLLFYLELS